MTQYLFDMRVSGQRAKIVCQPMGLCFGSAMPRQFSRKKAIVAAPTRVGEPGFDRVALRAWFKNGGFTVTQASETAPRMNAGIQKSVTQF